MLRRIVSSGLSLLVTLSLVTPVNASEAETGDKALYAGVPAGDEAAAEAATLLATFPLSGALTGEIDHVRTVLPPGEPAVTGARSQVPCTGEPVSLGQYREGMTRLEEAIQQLGETRPLIEELETVQACLSAIPDTRELAYLAFLEGVLEASDGRTEAAAAAFGEVFSVDPAYPWDASHPPNAQILFADAKTASAGEEAVTFALLLHAGAAAWLDGRAATSGQVEARPGRHLLQVQRGETLVSMIVHAEPGSSVSVVEPAVLDGPLPANADAALFPVLAAAGASHLVVLGEPPSVWSVGAVGLEVETARGDEEVAAGPAPMQVAGRVLLATGAGLALTGALVAGVGSKSLSDYEADVAAGLIYPWPDADDPDPENYEAYREWQSRTQVVDAGVALAVVGAVTLAAAIPVNIAAARRDRRVAVSARLIYGPPGGLHRGGIDGFVVTLHLR